jgi:hypothetical protein
VARITRVVVCALLVIITVSAAGCIHTWTQTYRDYPPPEMIPQHVPPQGNPSDG